MSWPTSEQFDEAARLGAEYAVGERENGATQAQESPLSGEWADGMTDRKVAHNVEYSLPNELWDDAEKLDQYHDGVRELADAWERGYFDA